MQSGQAVQTDTEGELDLITVEQAIEMSRGYISNRGSLYNLVYKNVLTRYGTRKRALFDRAEFEQYLDLKCPMEDANGKKQEQQPATYDD